MPIRRFHRGQLAGGILLCAVSMVCGGCYEEIAYDPATDAQGPDAGTPAATSQPDPSSDVEPVSTGVSSDQTQQPAAAADAELPFDGYAGADAAGDTARQPAETAVESDLFAEEVSQPETETPAPASQVQTNATSRVLLPWDAEEPEGQPEEGNGGNKPPNNPAVTPPPATARQDAVFPWDEPEPAAPEDPSVAPPEVQASSTAEPLPPPVVVESIPPADDAPQPLASQASALRAPATSRHAAWLLGSKLSYAMLAPEGEARQVVPELQPLAHLLGVELRELDFDGLRGTSAGMSQLLMVGREVGESLAVRHDPSHAALVEIALKSNLLMAVHAERPHLAHSIGGSVAAACVRAGIPEEIWQPWQDLVAAGGSTDEVTWGVLELHRQIDNFLQNPPNEASEAILR